MAENAVEDDRDTHFAGLFAQLAKNNVAAEHMVDSFVVGGIVFVVAGRFEQRVEIDGADTQVLEVGQLGHHSRQVAAKEIIGQDTARLPLPDIDRGIVPVRMKETAFFAVGDAAAGMAVKKPIDKNLVDNGVFKPIGSSRIRKMHGNLEGWRRGGGGRAEAPVPSGLLP